MCVCICMCLSHILRAERAYAKIYDRNVCLGHVACSVPPSLPCCSQTSVITEPQAKMRIRK